MNRVIYTPYFKTRAKRLIKKFKSLKDDLAGLEIDILNNPKLGESLGSNIYKVRLAVKSKGGGKSGGLRIITYLLEESEGKTDIFYLTIYDKSEEDSVSKNEFKEILNSLGL